MAQRYSKLPSEILSKGSTVDLMILSIVQQYNRSKTDNGQSDPQKYTQDQLLEIMNRNK